MNFSNGITHNGQIPDSCSGHYQKCLEIRIGQKFFIYNSRAGEVLRIVLGCWAIHKNRENAFRIIKNISEASASNKSSYFQVWSPNTEDVVATSSGDGSLQLWNFCSLETGSPTAYIPAHSAEIYSIDWGNSLSGNRLLTGSWDRTIKTWDPTYLKLISSFSAHSDVVFTANYSNSISNVFSSVGADGSLIIWDSSSPKPLQKVAAHDGEALTCTWNKFNSNVLATGKRKSFRHSIQLKIKRKASKWNSTKLSHILKIKVAQMV